MKRSEKFANLVFVSAIGLCLGMLIHGILINPSSSEFRHVVSLAGITLFAWALKWNPNTKVNFALTVISMGMTVYLLEIFLFFWAEEPTNIMSIPQANRITVAQQNGIPFDTRSKLQVLLDLRSQGIEAYPSVFPTFFIGLNGYPINGNKIYPLGGIANILSVYCNESGEWLVSKTDEHGFNNPKGLYRNREVDIVLVGDSFTFGYCVNPGEDIGSQLRQGDRKVLNLGNIANGPLIELATLKEYGEPFRPRTVLWIYFEGNDLPGLIVEKKSALLLKYMDNNFSKNLLHEDDKINNALFEYVNETIEDMNQPDAEIAHIWRSGLASIIKLTDLRRYLMVNRKSPPFDAELPLFRQVLTEARDRTSSWGGKLYFVYLSSWERYSESSNSDNLYHRDEVLYLVKELEIPIIDFHEAISTHPDPLSLFPFRLHGHYTAQGYRLLAQQIETYLESHSGD